MKKLCFKKTAHAVPVSVSLASLFAAVSCGSGQADVKLPNIVVFLVDDMGVMDTSVPFLADSCGQPLPHPLNSWYRTPNMQRLAGRGVRFSQFYANSVSSPSRTSLLTGQSAARHGVTNWIYSESDNRNTYGPYDWNWQGLDSNVHTLPRMLSERGYRTIHVGKAHFGPFGSQGEDPLNLGFDVNVAGCSIGEPGSYYGRDGYGLYGGSRARAVPDLERFHGSDTFLTDALTAVAKEKISEALEDGVPFFLNMAHYAVHWPFMPDGRYAGNYTDSVFGRDASCFASLIESMDRSLGELLDFLEEKGIAEETLVIFLGDNGSDAPLGDERGYSSSAPLRGKKGTEFEGGMRVPFIVSWASPESGNRVQERLRIPCGELRTQFGTIMDIYPTLAAVTGSEVPEGHVLDGHDLGRIISEGTDTAHHDIFMMHFPHEHRGKYFTVYREGDWKLIYYWSPENPENAGCSLYNLNMDPFETNDMAGEYSDVAMELLRRMSARLEREGASYPVDGRGNPLSVSEQFSSGERNQVRR